MMTLLIVLLSLSPLFAEPAPANRCADVTVLGRLQPDKKGNANLLVDAGTQNAANYLIVDHVSARRARRYLGQDVEIRGQVQISATERRLTITDIRYARPFHMLQTKDSFQPHKWIVCR